MNVLAIDVETTGLDVTQDRIIELGYVVWSVEDKVPLHTASPLIWLPDGPDSKPLTPEITQITGIKQEWLDKYGLPLREAFEVLEAVCNKYGVEYICAHNGENYDRPLILAELGRLHIDYHPLQKLPWADTRTDLPFDREPSSRRLSHLALDHGFLNPFEHRALFDCLTMMKLVSKYDFNKIIEQSKIPWVTVRALVDYDNREKAKEQRFSWENLGDKKYPKWWVKKIRENALVKEQEIADSKGFKVVRIE